MLERPKKLNVPSQKETNQIKVALIGDQQVGKTSIVSKYTNNNFLTSYQPTLGVDVFQKIINIKGQQTHLTFWDFSGKIDFIQVRNQMYKQTNLILLVVDLSNKSSIQSVDYWMRQVKDNGGQCSIYIVGNKSDIKKVNADLTKAARQKDGIYLQISSKTGEGIQNLMNSILNEFK